MAIILAFCCCQDHSSSLCHLLWGAMPTHQRFQFLLFLFAQRQRFRFRAMHALCPPLFCWPYFTPELFQPQCTSSFSLQSEDPRVSASCISGCPPDYSLNCPHCLCQTHSPSAP